MEESHARHTSILCGRDLFRLCGQSRPGLGGKACATHIITSTREHWAPRAQGPHVAAIPTCLPGGKQDLNISFATFVAGTNSHCMLNAPPRGLLAKAKQPATPD